MFSYLCAALVFVAAYTAQVQGSRNPICKQKNSYSKADTSCDAYIMCTEFVPEKKSCPQGLHYNPEVKWPSYPCEHRTKVSCGSYGSGHNDVDDCPRPHGYFPSPSATSDDCGHYIACVAGKPTEMKCPVGLAFNPETSNCDWPHLVASCDADQFLGFSCPTDDDGSPLDVIANYEDKGDSYYFFSCENGHARLLSCDSGLVFDPAVGRCVDGNHGNYGQSGHHCVEFVIGNDDQPSRPCVDAHHGKGSQAAHGCVEVDYGNNNQPSRPCVNDNHNKGGQAAHHCVEVVFGNDDQPSRHCKNHGNGNQASLKPHYGNCKSCP